MAPSAPEQSANASSSAAPSSGPQHASVHPFFESVSQDGFPQGKGNKAQPWKAHVTGLEQPSEDGKIVVACPKLCNYGSNVVGGS